MHTFKYFSAHGSNYVLKKSAFLSALMIVLGMLFLSSLFIFGKDANTAAKILMAVFGVFFLLGGFAKFREIFVFDRAQNRLVTKTGIMGISKNFSLERFLRFEVHKLSYLGFINVMSTVHMYFLNDGGKEIPVGIKSFLFQTRPAQCVIDEITRIISSEHEPYSVQNFAG